MNRWWCDCVTDVHRGGWNLLRWTSVWLNSHGHISSFHLRVLIDSWQHSTKRFSFERCTSCDTQTLLLWVNAKCRSIVFWWRELYSDWLGWLEFNTFERCSAVGKLGNRRSYSGFEVTSIQQNQRDNILPYLPGIVMTLHYMFICYSR